MSVILAGLAGAIVLFITDGLLQRIPYVAITKEEFAAFEGVKKWDKENRPLLQKTLIFLGEGFLFALAFAVVRNGLSDNAVFAALQFWFVIATVRILPESVEFWHETNYPPPLIRLEAGMDAVTGLAAAFTYSLFIS